MIVHPELLKAYADARTDELLRGAAPRRAPSRPTISDGRWRDLLRRAVRRLTPSANGRQQSPSSLSTICDESSVEQLPALNGYRELIDGRPERSSRAAALKPSASPRAPNNEQRRAEARS